MKPTSPVADQEDDQEPVICKCSVTACTEIFATLNDYSRHLLEHFSELTAQPLSSDVAICNDSVPKPDDEKQELLEASAEPTGLIDMIEICQGVLLGQAMIECARQLLNNTVNQPVDRPIAPGSPVKLVARSEKDDRIFLCKKCPFKTKSIQHLTSHENAHAEHKALHECTVCGAQFSQKSNLKRHSTGHELEPFMTCILCPRTFYRKDQMMEHLLSHWNSYTVIVVCPVEDCKKLIEGRRLLKIHMRTEHALGENNCIHCSKSYRADRLTRHSLNVYSALFSAVVVKDRTTNPINLDCSPSAVIGIKYPQLSVSQDDGNESQSSSSSHTPDSINNAELNYSDIAALLTLDSD